MDVSDVFPPRPHPIYEVIYPSTWDTRWQINKLLGVINDLILIVDCEQQEINVLPTQVLSELNSQFNWIEFILEQLQKQDQSSESSSIIQEVLASQTSRQIIYQYNYNQKDHYLLTEIYPLSTTAVMAVSKDISQCQRGQNVLHNPSQKPELPAPNQELQTANECLKKQIEERQQIEIQLKTRKKELETLMDNAGDCIVRLDEKLRYVYANRQFSLIVGIPRQQLIGKTHEELGFPSSICQQWDWNSKQLLSTRKPQQFEFQLETAEGWRSFQTLMVPEIQDQGEIKTLLATTRDITKQKQALSELQQHNQFLQLLTEITLKIRQSLQLDLILKTTVDEVQKVLNVDRVIMLKLYPKMGGNVVQEAVLPQWSSLLSQKIYIPEWNQHLSNFSIPDQVISFGDIDQINLDHSYLQLMEYFQVKASLIVPIWLGKEDIYPTIEAKENPEIPNNYSTQQPKFWGFIMVHQCAKTRQWTTQEINFLKQLADQVGIALKQAQLITELKQAHKYLSCHFDNSPLAVIEWDQQLKIKRWSPQAERIFGWKSAEILGQQWSDFQGIFATDILKVTKQMIQLIDGTETHQIIEAQNRTKDGKIIDCEWYNSVVRDEDGSLVSLLSLAQNVSDRKQAEQALVTSEERFRTIFEQAAVGFAVVNLSGELLRVNQRYCDITGYSEKELIGRTFHDFIDCQDLRGQDWLEQIQEQNLLETFSIEKQYIRRDGQLNWVQIFISTLNQLWQENHYILLALEDIEKRKQTEEALRKSEERWQLALRGNNDGIWDWNIQTQEVFFSPRWKEMLGYQEQEICDHLTQWKQRVHHDDLPGVIRAIREHLDQKKPFYISEHRVQCKNGSYKWILDRGQALWDHSENLVRMVGSYTDISDRKRAEQELHRVNRALKTISECNQALVRATTEIELLNDICQILIDVGDYHFAWVGYPEQTPEKRIIPVAKAGFEAGYLDNLVITWDDSESGRGPSGTAVRTGETCVFQNFDHNSDYAPWKKQAQKRGYTSSISFPLIIAPENQQQHLTAEFTEVISESTPIPFGVLNLYSTRSNAFDQAEVKLLKELVNDILYGIKALRMRASHVEAEKKFRQLADNIDDVFWITNAPGNQFIYVSTAYQKIWNRNSSALYENFQTFIDTIHPQDQNLVLLALQSPDGKGFDLEYRILLPDGSWRWIWDRGFPILNETGQLDRRGGIAKDITHRKQTEQLLQQNNQELELRVIQRTAELETANEQLQFQLMQRHRTEFKLRKSEEQYRTLVENFPDGAVFLFDLDFRYTIADGMGLVAKGLSRNMLEGKTIWQVLPAPLLEIVEPLYRSALAGEITISEVEYDGRIYYHQALPVRNQQEEVLAGMVVMQDITEQKQNQANLRETERRWRSLLENVRLLVVGLDRQGKVEYVNPFLLEVTRYTKTEVLGKNWLDNFQPHLAQKINSPTFSEILDHDFKPYNQQLIITKSGEERIIAWNNTLLKNLQGEAIGMMSIGEDITERDAIERMKDEFISVVSHELRTPLTSIHGGLNLLSTGLLNPASERGIHVMKIAAESAERLVRLVNDILELERLESGKICLSKQVINSADLLLRATEQIQVMANRTGINLEVCSQSLNFYADSDRVLQVLTNLLSNAIKFSESGNTIWLSVEEIAENIVENRAILFKVRDQGRGIPRDKIEQIFERFHQVDASDSRKKGGTGLGLAICRSIVEQHGGRIWLESKLDEGSCFYFTLPIDIPAEVLP
jgi:PAS domain S-box